MTSDGAVSVRPVLASLDHIQLAIPAGGEDVARVFYGEILGLTEVVKPPELAKRGGVWFRSGAIVLHLGVDAEFRPAGKAHPAFRCQNYAETLRYFTQRGVPIVPDDLLFEGSEHCYVSDPFGNRIELIAAVPATA